MPKRIQRSRARGWKMPAGALYVGRPTHWGNPLVGHGAAEAFWFWVARRTVTLREAVDVFNADGFDVLILDGYEPTQTAAGLPLDELRGRDLVCWCAVGKPCHADALLEFSNR